jgi:hypothetical protein
VARRLAQIESNGFRYSREAYPSGLNTYLRGADRNN